MADSGVDGTGGTAAGSALDELSRPVTILVGPAGSGKTEIALNLAFGWRARGVQVTLVDLDLIKPFFRCRLAKDDLAACGIRLVAPGGDRFYADLPILLPEARAAGCGGGPEGTRFLFDVGGDDLGARVLGSLAGILTPAVTDLLFIVNTNRPFAEDLAALRRLLAAIQSAARLAVTGLVANTHLLGETTPAMIREGIRVARQLAAAAGIRLRFCCMLQDLTAAFGGPEGTADSLGILAMERHIVPPFAARPAGAARRAAVV